jgi:septal ring factor EnvC (AmiA/AmiB activator)
METVKCDNQRLNEKVNHAANQQKELCEKLDAERAENETLKQQLTDKYNEHHHLTEQIASLKEHLEAVKQADQGTKRAQHFYLKNRN